MSFMKIGTGKAILYLCAYMKSHLEIMNIMNALVKFLLLHRVHHLQVIHPIVFLANKRDSVMCEHNC